MGNMNKLFSTIPLNSSSFITYAQYDSYPGDRRVARFPPRDSGYTPPPFSDLLYWV